MQRIATDYHKMPSIDHLHTESEMLKVREHSELLSAQYLVRCMERRHYNTRHRNTVEPMMVEKDGKATLQALHIDAVNKVDLTAAFDTVNHNV